MPIDDRPRGAEPTGSARRSARRVRGRVVPSFGALLVAMVALGACASVPREDQGSSTLEAYVPLAVGQARTYAMRFPGQEGERTVRIVRRDAEGYFIDDAGGSWAITASGLRDRDRYLIRAPLEVGTKWRAVVSASAVEHYEIVSVGEPCEARAGTFSDCLVVASRLRRDAKVSLLGRFTWAKGVGLVKVETRAEVAGRGELPQTEQSLIRYELKPASPLGEADSAGARPPSPAIGRDREGAPDAWGR